MIMQINYVQKKLRIFLIFTFNHELIVLIIFGFYFYVFRFPSIHILSLSLSLSPIFPHNLSVLIPHTFAFFALAGIKLHTYLSYQSHEKCRLTDLKDNWELLPTKTLIILSYPIWSFPRDIASFMFYYFVSDYLRRRCSKWLSCISTHASRRLAIPWYIPWYSWGLLKNLFNFMTKYFNTFSKYGVLGRFQVTLRIKI